MFAHTLHEAYHGQKHSKLWVQRHDITVGKDKLFLPVFFRLQHDVDLLCGHRQYGQINTIELIKTAP